MSAFERRVADAVRAEAQRRARGRRYPLSRLLLAGIPRDRWKPWYRVDPAAMEAAVLAEAAAFGPEERAAFEAGGALPGTFWERVERRARDGFPSSR